MNEGPNDEARVENAVLELFNNHGVLPILKLIISLELKPLISDISATSEANWPAVGQNEIPSEHKGKKVELEKDK